MTTPVPSFTISFLGGATDIGASCAVLECGATRIVVDCGIRFSSDPLPDLSGLNGKAVDAIFLTHAHTDHTGALPVLCEAFPTAPVYATPSTFDLVEILLRDAIRLMKTQEQEGDVPLYNPVQVDNAISAFHPVPFHQSTHVKDCEFTFLPAGHILGAAMLHSQTPAGNILFTGDYSITAQRTVPALTRPAMHTDLVITESTYGERLHENRNGAESRLVKRVSSILEQKGKILIPAFAIGRAQELLLILKKAQRNGQLSKVPIYVDGMVRAVCECYKRHADQGTRYLENLSTRENHPFYSDLIKPVASPDQRKKICQEESCVIVASSGMLAGGPSAYYAAQLAPHAKNAILITGYQDEESPGRKLLNIANGQSEKKLTVAGATVEVQCQFETYGLSAHADRMQITGFLSAINPRAAVLVHGNASAKAALASGLNCTDVIIALNGQQVSRSYPIRHRTSGAQVIPLSALDADSAQKFLGPIQDKALNARQLASAWYGRPSNHKMTQAFVQHLEELGLVKPDDHHPQLLWQKDNQRKLTDALTSENPKNTLLETCAKLGLPLPRLDLRQDGEHYEATFHLQTSQKTLSANAKARVRKNAEQLAAKHLLNKIIQKQNVSVFHTVDDNRAASLKTANPKGKVLEWCMQKKVPMAQFHRKASPQGLIICAELKCPDQTVLNSQWFQAQDRKTAEQAASHQLLEKIKHNQSIPPPDRAAKTDISANQAEGALKNPQGPPLSLPDPRVELNLLKQKGYITQFGFTILEQSGPTHAPRFLMEGWLTLNSGETVTTESVESCSKKEGRQLAAAKALIIASNHMM